ncbi:hypothetical protein ACFL35_19985 [Candidatus Riflebacteria bacterium]
MEFIRKIFDLIHTEDRVPSDEEDSSWFLPEDTEQTDTDKGEKRKGYLEFKEELLNLLFSPDYSTQKLKKVFDEFMQVFGQPQHAQLVSRFKLDLYDNYANFTISDKHHSTEGDRGLRDLKKLLNLKTEEIGNAYRRKTSLIDKELFLQFLKTNDLDIKSQQNFLGGLEDLGKEDTAVTEKLDLKGAVNELERIMAFCRADQFIDDFESKRLLLLIKLSRSEPEKVADILLEIQNYVRIWDVRQKNYLPIKRPPFKLEPGKFCRWYGKAGVAFLAENSRIISEQINIVIITNKDLFIRYTNKLISVPFSMFRRVFREGYKIGIELSEKIENSNILALGFASMQSILLVWELILKEKDNLKLNFSIEVKGELPSLNKKEKYTIWEKFNRQCMVCSSKKYLTFDWQEVGKDGSETDLSRLGIICEPCNFKRKKAGIFELA